MPVASNFETQKTGLMTNYLSACFLKLNKNWVWRTEIIPEGNSLKAAFSWTNCPQEKKEEPDAVRVQEFKFTVMFECPRVESFQK